MPSKRNTHQDQKLTSNQAEWIWYPGDFEIWLRREVELRRDERGIITPPIWRVDSPCVSIRFRKKVHLEEPDVIDVFADGQMRLVIDGLMHEGVARQIPLSSGSHDIVAEVVNRNSVPSLYVLGKQVGTDHTWGASSSSDDYVPAGFGGFTDPCAPPSGFHLPTVEVSAQSLNRDNDGLLVDFGRETFGYVKLHDVRGHGLIRLQYGESLDEANDAEACETFDVVNAGSGLQGDVILDKARAMRYLRVIAPTAVQIDNVSLLHEYAPLNFRGQFYSSDEMLNRIWNIAAYTFHLNTREFYLDGIKRDRWVWSGDAYQSYLMNYYLFFDQEITQRTMVALRGKDPLETHLNTILDYSLYWVLGLNDYYQYTGDLQFVERNYGKMLSLMEFCKSNLNQNGLLEGTDRDWVFVDWANLDTSGEVSFEQILYYLSLGTVQRFAQLFDDERTYRLCREDAEALRERIREGFWDEQAGAYIHRRIAGERDQLITKHANILALLYGFLSHDERQRIKSTVLKNPKVSPITTPYMRFYELAALCEVGEHWYVREEINAYWGGMVQNGATTFWEEYNPDVPIPEQYAMYGRPYGKSLCHAWGASPLYILGRYFLGVTPAAPGYDEILIEPNLGGLTWMRGTVPTPHGDVEVFMDQHSIQITTVDKLTKLRFSSTENPFAERGEIRNIGDGLYELVCREGSGTYKVSYRSSH